ncbi:S26 family signal peptidase [Streptomyces polygonati]|uniref:Mitochondrial inner membrane protease subunit 2 n=1 Tax=Streptomyces polygonati TaxID=1617087 RepID=A0ABV8HXT0_9ACTN
MTGASRAATAPAAALGCALALTLAARALLLLVTVEGASMEPTHHEGDRLLMLRRPVARLRRGRVVVVRGPFTPPGRPAGGGARYAVKRLAALPHQPVPAGTAASHGIVPPGRVAVLGDNPDHSTDSREWGLISERRIIGVVLGRISTAR